MGIRILGITGPTGAGKSLLSKHLKQAGIPVIDADEVYHALLIPPSPCLNALVDAFGGSILRADGSLHRPALSEIVFHNEEKLALLNRTVLGFVLEEIRAQIRALESDGHPTVAVDAPTLIESGFHRECDTVISVLAPKELRVLRIMARDGMDEAKALARINAQHEDDFYRAHSHLVLENRTDEVAFRSQIEAYLPVWQACPDRKGAL